MGLKRSSIESGRSLTEMLGVLAVIGIITVVSVKLFDSAMSQHRANEVIHEANKRAVSVAGQIMAGKDKNDLSVAEFLNPDGYTFGVETNPQNTDQFNITITGVSADTCARMKTMFGSATSIRVISGGCDKITYNDDLSSTEYSTDYATQENACKGAGFTWCSKGDNMVIPTCSTNADCCNGVTLHPQCQTCDSTTGQITNISGSCTYTYPDNTTKIGTCDAGICLNPDVEAGAPCLSNEDCGGIGSGYYCKYTVSNASKLCAASAAEALGCSGLTPDACEDAGTCTPIGIVKYANIYGLGRVVITPSSRWWSVKNWCETQGKSLIEVDRFQCFQSGKTELYASISANSENLGCCAKGKVCRNWSNEPYNKMWSGSTLTNEKDENGELYSAKYSPIVIDLRKQFTTSFWTASKSASTACTAFYLLLGRGTLEGPARWYDNRPGLCQ